MDIIIAILGGILSGIVAMEFYTRAVFRKSPNIKIADTIIEVDDKTLQTKIINMENRVIVDINIYFYSIVYLEKETNDPIKSKELISSKYIPLISKYKSFDEENIPLGSVRIKMPLMDTIGKIKKNSDKFMLVITAKDSLYGSIFAKSIMFNINEIKKDIKFQKGYSFETTTINSK
jgi:hypothetical protein